MQFSLDSVPIKSLFSLFSAQEKFISHTLVLSAEEALFNPASPGLFQTIIDAKQIHGLASLAVGPELPRTGLIEQTQI